MDLFPCGPWGKHSVADPGEEWGHSVVWIRVLSGHILLTPLLLDYCHWGWRWSLLKEWCNCSSVWCGHGGLGDGKVHLWDHMEAWQGALLVCWHPGNWLWCCCTLLLLPLLLSHELLIRESPLGHLAASFLLLSAEVDLAQDEEHVCKCLLPLDRDWAVPITPQSPALTRHWPNSSCSSVMNWSWSLWVSMLSTISYCPLYTYSATSRISSSVYAKRVLTEGCSRDILSAIAVCWGWWHLHEGCCHSFLHIAVVLWNKCSNRKSPHSWCWIVLQSGCSLLSSSRNSWPLRAHSTALFEWPIVRVTIFAHLLKAAKLPYCRVNTSSILQWCIISIMIILVWN